MQISDSRVPTIPPRVTLCAIGYTVKIAEGMVLFASEPGVWGCYTRLAFARVCGCWYVSISSSGDRAMVSHIAEAQRLVSEWFGGNHNCKRGENVP